MEKCVRAEKIIKMLLEELERLRKKVSEVMDDVDNCIAKSGEDEIRKDLNYIFVVLGDLYTEIKDFCIGDCSLCTKNCEIMCNVDCYECVRFFKCLQEKKVSRMVFD